MQSVTCLERTSPPWLPNKLKSLAVWPKTYQIFQSQDNLFRNLGSPKIGNALRPQVPFLSIRQTGQKTTGLFSSQQGTLKRRLHSFLERWKQITSDPEILNVASGYQIPLHYVPVQLHVPVTIFSDLSAPLVDAEVNKLLSLGAINKIPFSKVNFYSRLFLVPKKKELIAR